MSLHNTEAPPMEFEERHQPGNVPDPHEHGNKYGDLSMSGNAQAFLGNAYSYSTGSADRQEDREQELLFKSLYYGQMDDRKTDVTTAKVQTCQWIWSTIFRRWLRAHQPKAFWIAGKPGSGKSTLMKYLASSTDVVSNLPDHRPGWLVVSFFFDFRLADEVGNSVTGLLRSLLFQIIDALPQTANSKDVRNSVLQRLHGHWRQSRTPSTDQLTEAFQDVIRTSDQNIFVLVDGLDEFTGNPVPLLEFLLSLRRYRSLKICLASRPESEIREILGVLPNIHMSEHNEVGMQQYISLKIQRFQPRLDMLKLLNIQGTLVEKSQGVFLWVHLALEEVLQAGLRGATAPEIKQALASFPVELHTLYQRILARIPLGRRLEAAMMYMLISSATFQVTVALLRSTMRFVILQLGLYDFLADILDEEHFLRRFHATVGGLLELEPLSERLYADFEDYEAGSLRIRLIHETVRSFTRRSQWTDMFIPKNFKQLFPNNFWQRIGSKALLVGNIRTIGVSTSILSSVHGQHKNFTEFSNIIQHNSKDDMLRSLIPLIHHSIRFLPVIFETGRRQAEHDQLRAELPGIMRCRLASMHFALVGAHYGDGVRFLGASLAHEVSDLMIAAGHRNFTYVHENMHRIRQLQDHQRDDIVMAAIFSCRRWGSACVTDDLQQYDEEQSSLHHTVDVILSINNHYHSFHLAIFLILGFAGSARYILKMQDQFASRSRRAWEPVRVPRWNLKNGIGPLFPSADPLCLWACEYDAYPQQSNDRSARLQVLISLGVDVHQLYADGGNIIHYIISTHVFDHSHRIRGSRGCYPTHYREDVVDKLAILEHHNVSFTARGPFGTPLQTLIYHYEQKKEKYNNASIGRFCIRLGAALKHKEQMGHLPQPLPRNLSTKPMPDASVEMPCERCNTRLFENPRPAPAPASTSQPTLQQLTVQQPTPERSSPSRIPRLRRSPLPR